MKFILITLLALTTLLQAVPPVQNHTIRVNSTLQKWSPAQPWDKSAPTKRRALGALLPNHQVLTTAEMAADATYIELENADGTRSIPAKVIAIDYEANLALLTAKDKENSNFFDTLKPLAISEPAKIGEKVSVWQLEDNGVPLATEVTIQGADIVSSFSQGHYFLTYEAKGSMQSASSSFSLPVIKNGKLVGLLTSYNSKDQITDVLAPEIITAFLTDVKDGEYAGFPSLGIGISNTVDPNFRTWLKLPDDVGGIYVTRVRKGSGAEEAGLQKGDVVLSVSGKAIGRRGYYIDQHYGKLFWSHLVRGVHKVGDKVNITILREGKKQTLNATLRRPSSKLVPTQTYGTAPRYLVKGGFIFQELTTTYLQAFGKDWESKAPLDLLDVLTSPEDYEKGRNRIVLLTATVPTPATTGYERMRNLIIAKINGKKIADIPSLIEAFKSPGANGLHTIEFADGNPKKIYLDASISDMVDAELLKRGIPKLSHQ